MLNQERTQALADILSLTIAQTEAAQEGAWDHVRSMDRRRLELLTNFFDQPTDASERHALGDQLRELVRADEKLIEVATQARDGIASRVKQNKRQRSGVAAYRQASAQG